MTEADIKDSPDKNDKRVIDPMQETDPFYAPANQNYILKAIKEIREGKGSVHELREDE